MTMLFQLVGPIIASVLYVIVFQKAGFKGAIMFVCAAPVVGALFVGGLMAGMMGYSGAAAPLLFLMSWVLSLAPLLVLAFMAWPPVSAATTHTEK
jgi:hypothetical protein